MYFALDDAERIWYVGKAVKQTLRDRLASHERLSDFKAAGVTHIAHLAINEGDIDYYEENAKKRFDPPLNVEMSTPHLRRPAFIIDGLTPKQQAERFIECKRIIEEIVPPLELELKAYKPNIVSYVEDSGGTGVVISSWLEGRFFLVLKSPPCPPCLPCPLHYQLVVTTPWRHCYFPRSPVYPNYSENLALLL